MFGISPALHDVAIFSYSLENDCIRTLRFQQEIVVQVAIEMDWRDSIVHSWIAPLQGDKRKHLHYRCIKWMEFVSFKSSPISLCCSRINSDPRNWIHFTTVVSNWRRVGRMEIANSMMWNAFWENGSGWFCRLWSHWTRRFIIMLKKRPIFDTHPKSFECSLQYQTPFLSNIICTALLLVGRVAQ